MEQSLSISARVTRQHLVDNNYDVLHQARLDYYDYMLLLCHRELLVHVRLPNGRLLLLRLLYLSDPLTSSPCVQIADHSFIFKISNAVGAYHIRLELTATDVLQIRYKIDFRPAAAIYGMDEPREVIILHEKGLQVPPKGQTYVQQQQLRSGICFMDFGKDTSGTLLYFQNLSVLNAYAEDTKLSLSDCVKAVWPELGFSLPESSDSPLQKGKKYGYRDAYIVFHPGKPKDVREASRLYLSLLAGVYQQIVRPKPTVRPLQRYAIKVLADLARHHGCWQQVGEHAYLNAYLNDYHSPAESMVQMAVLGPLLAYEKTNPSRAGKRICSALLLGFSGFYDEKLDCFVRWLPEKAHHLDHAEEQKKPRIVDSWYIHHPLIHIAFVLEQGLANGELERQFYNSLSYCMRVARHFDYTWPIFYDMDTWEVEKKEATTGAGGEKDVAGMYAFLMLRAYALSKKQVYFTEAKRAAKSLRAFGFDLIYQANNTAYAAEALLELWTLTKEKVYLELSELCLGNLIRNTGLWERRYGNSKEYPSFFALYPLTDAPYSAVFEEQECIASFHRLLRMAYHAKAPLSPEINTFLAEYIKYASERLPYYFPPLLPEDTLAPKVKTGYLNKNLWMPVEDLGDGWGAIGAVGQEVYGAGCLFALVPLHSLELDDPEHTCFINYPFIVLKRTARQVRIQLLGSAEYTCMLRLYVGQNRSFTLKLANGREIDLHQKRTPIETRGNQELTISW